MAAIAPGLFTEGPAVATRVFLGQSPTLKVEAMLTRHMQAVYPWYATRRRTNEQGNLYLDLDAAACDSDLVFRYSHTFYVRRQMYQDLLDKQLTLLDTGKLPKEASAAVLQALGDIDQSLNTRIEYERRRMTWAKERANVPDRRELDTTALLDPWDVPCMMRCVAEDETSVDAERRAKAFLPVDAVDEAIDSVMKYYFGLNAVPFDKKYTKLVAKHTPPDYDKVGVIPKLRPIDVTTRARFMGEKMTPPAEGPFAALLWGHVLRRHAQHAGFLHYASRVGSPPGAVSTFVSGDVKMPLALAEFAAKQQVLFPATRFRAQFLYTSVDQSKHAWRSDQAYIPMPRLLPLIGAAVSDDLLAAVLVDGWWAKNMSEIDPSSSLLQDDVANAVRNFVHDTAPLRETSIDILLNLAVDSAKVAIPTALTAAEAAYKPAPLEEAQPPAAAAEDVDDELADEGTHAEAEPEETPTDLPPQQRDV